MEEGKERRKRRKIRKRKKERMKENRSKKLEFSNMLLCRKNMPTRVLKKTTLIPNV